MIEAIEKTNDSFCEDYERDNDEDKQKALSAVNDILKTLHHLQDRLGVIDNRDDYLMVS